MTKGIINPGSLHSLRQEFREARRRKIDRLEAELAQLKRQEAEANFAKRQAITIVVEDAIFTRLVDAEELLTVAFGLFTELAEDQDNWLFKFKGDIDDARWALHNVVHDRPFA